MVKPSSGKKALRLVMNEEKSESLKRFKKMDIKHGKM